MNAIMMRALEAVLPLLVLGTPVAAAALEGTVTTSDGIPVEGAWVTTGDGAVEATTDGRGRFAFPDVEPPAVLVAHHSRFATATVTVEEEGPVTIALAPKQTVFEEIVVSADRGRERVAPVTVTADRVSPAEEPSPPSTLREAVDAVPGVAENGQGGIFQVFSIRGVSRQRVMTRIAGTPLVSERRAGTSGSFLDPLLMGTVDVVRGPSSTHYGSGALGGVVQIFPRASDTPWASVGWDSDGDERWLAGGSGGGEWSIGVAAREADNGETAEGTELHSQFRQLSGVVAREWEVDGGTLDLTLVPTYGEDIGKANTRFPVETTTYPRERHLLGRLRLLTDGGWSVEVFGHPNDLETLDEEPDGRNRVTNESLDFGFATSREVSFSNGIDLQAGVDYFARRDVTATEERFDLAGDRTGRLRTLDDAERDDVSAYLSTRWEVSRATIAVGSRVTWQRQSNAGGPSRDDSAVDGFLGTVIPFGDGFELAANVGTGLRFPSLSERFFTGTTGRGEVVANRDLDPERSVSADLGVRYFGHRLHIVVSGFVNEIDDYIERIEIEPGIRTFVNLTSGEILGLELDGFAAVTERWTIRWGGHLMEGRSDDDEPLADIPADRFDLGLTYRRGPWRAETRWEHRTDKDDPGSGEQAIPSAELISASVGYNLADDVELSVSGRNLLDETYFTAADDLLPPAPGRSVSVGLSWSAP